MKKIAVMFLVLLLATTMVIPAAAAIDLKKPTPATSKENEMAYTKIDDTTSEAMEKQILAARNRIIFSTSWVADGMNCHVSDKNGNIKRIIPNFSDVFPDDWELPDLDDQEEASSSYVPWQSETIMPLSMDLHPFYNNSVWLSKPSGDHSTSPFCSFSTTNNLGGGIRGCIEEVYTFGYHEESDATYNVGYSNEDTKKSLGFVEHLSNGESCDCEPPFDITLGVRASTYTNPGFWTMSVIGKYVT